MITRDLPRRLSDAAYRVARTLFGIERLGVSDAGPPPPIYIGLAAELQFSPELRAALRNALETLEAEQGSERH